MYTVVWIGYGCVSWDAQCTLDWISISWDVQCNVDLVGLCQLGCAVKCGLGYVSWDVQCNMDWVGLCQLGCAV